MHGETAPFGRMTNVWPARVDPGGTLPLYRRLAELSEEGLVRSATTPAGGGWGLAFARTVLAGETGLDLDLGDCDDLDALAPDVALFSESAGRVLITVAPAEADRVERHFRGLSCRRVGHVTERARLNVRAHGRTWLDVGAGELRAAFRERLDDE